MRKIRMEEFDRICWLHNTGMISPCCGDHFPIEKPACDCDIKYSTAICHGALRFSFLFHASSTFPILGYLQFFESQWSIEHSLWFLKETPPVSRSSQIRFPTQLPSLHVQILARGPVHWNCWELYQQKVRTQEGTVVGWTKDSRTKPQRNCGEQNYIRYACVPFDQKFWHYTKTKIEIF